MKNMDDPLGIKTYHICDNFSTFITVLFLEFQLLKISHVYTCF